VYQSSEINLSFGNKHKVVFEEIQLAVGGSSGIFPAMAGNNFRKKSNHVSTLLEIPIPGMVKMKWETYDICAFLNAEIFNPLCGFNAKFLLRSSI